MSRQHLLVIDSLDSVGFSGHAVFGGCFLKHVHVSCETARQATVATTHFLETGHMTDWLPYACGEVVAGLGGKLSNEEFSWHSLDHFWDVDCILRLSPWETGWMHLKLLIKRRSHRRQFSSKSEFLWSTAHSRGIKPIFRRRGPCFFQAHHTLNLTLVVMLKRSPRKFFKAFAALKHGYIQDFSIYSRYYSLIRILSSAD